MKYYSMSIEQATDYSYRQIGILIKEMTATNEILTGAKPEKKSLTKKRATTQQDLDDAAAMGCPDPEGLI
jgi:hypothetical protein